MKHKTYTVSLRMLHEEGFPITAYHPILSLTGISRAEMRGAMNMAREFYSSSHEWIASSEDGLVVDHVGPRRVHTS